MPGGAADQPWIRGSPDRIASAVVSPSKGPSTMAASWIPARAATKADPLQTVRY